MPIKAYLHIKKYKLRTIQFKLLKLLIAKTCYVGKRLDESVFNHSTDLGDHTSIVQDECWSGHDC